MRESIAWTDERSGLATLCADARAFTGPDDEPAAAEPAAGPAVDARVLSLAPPRRGRAVCICSNLSATADAFAQLSGEELFGLPAGMRRHVHDALVGVWQILDLVQRMEEAGVGTTGDEPDDDAGAGLHDEASAGAYDEASGGVPDDSSACGIGSDQPHSDPCDDPRTRGVRKTPGLRRALRGLRDRIFPGA
jgi:hypothetical protein